MRIGEASNPGPPMRTRSNSSLGDSMVASPNSVGNSDGGARVPSPMLVDDEVREQASLGPHGVAVGDSAIPRMPSDDDDDVYNGDMPLGEEAVDPTSLAEPDGHFPVTAIRKSRWRKEGVQYLVAWEGYPDDDT